MPNPHSHISQSDPTPPGLSRWSVPRLLWDILMQQIRNYSLLETIVPTITEQLTALDQKIKANSAAENAQVLDAVNGLKAQIQALQDSIATPTPEQQAALDAANDSADKIVDIFTPDAPTV